MKFHFLQGRRLLFILILQLLVAPNLFSQNIAINTTGNQPDASAMLDVTSTNMGFLAPRMSTAQMNGIVSPATGLLIYNTSLSVFEVNIGTAASPNWVPISTSKNGWSTTGNAGTNSGINAVGYAVDGNFVGTTDANALTFGVNNNKVGIIDTRGNILFGGSADPAGSTTSSVASGSTLVNNFLVGSNNTSNSKNGIAFGTGNIINGASTMAMAFGTNNTVGNSVSAGNRALAIGTGNQSTGSYSAALGNGNSSSSNYAFTQGQNDTASAQFAQALGEQNKATAVHATAIGQLNTASGLESFAWGYGNTSSAIYSKTFGSFLTAATFNETDFGQYNAFTSGNATGIDVTDPLFQVGIGSSVGAPQNALTILKNGQTAIGLHSIKPAATLDIDATTTTGTSTTTDGLLIPRVDRQRAQSMTGVSTSTLIYVNNIATGTQTGTAINMDAIGYYYYNGSAWAKLNPSITNIYNSDGTLTGNRAVTQGANTLAFTSTATNGFSVDGSVFSVDGANNRVGIGTATPLNTLHVVAATASNNRFNLFDGANGTNGNVLAAFRNTSALATGNQALIGFTNNGPTVGGANWAIGSVRSGNTNTLGAEEDFIIENSLGSNYLPRLRITNSGNVGINISSPLKRLHVNAANSSSVADSLKIDNLALSAGNSNKQYLVIDSATGYVSRSNVLPGMVQSIAVTNTTGASAYTIKTTDYIIEFTGTSTATWTLPSSPVTGQVYHLVNMGTADVTLSASITLANSITSTTLGTGTGNIQNTSATSTVNILGNKSSIVYDGTKWIQIAN